MAYKDTARKKLESKKLGQVLAKKSLPMQLQSLRDEQVKVKPKPKRVLGSNSKSGMWRLGGEDLKEGR